MRISKVDLFISAVRRSQYPTDNKPEFLIVGRSNVGKSSFVNTLIHRKNFARTSGRPGKTQTLNFYSVNDDFYLVDVPGYGYASVNKTQQQKFGMMIEEYLQVRDNLKEVFMLVDFRHKPSANDLLMYNFLKFHEQKVTIVATKVDKIALGQRDKYKKIILDTLDLVMGDSFILFSSISKEGKKEAHEVIAKYLDFIDEE
ncbi:MAG: ribosome biogenesis GTP-binding protein YihA/YsxC [Bacilli bacterium]|nr:ribosome biogenesis GTP-binding protein YihA/YsxC [Bacilli bacterium]